MITENLSTLKIHKLTQEQYNRELASGNIDETALYLTPNEIVSISEGGTGAITAEEARINLGITPENIGALQMEVVTYTGTGVYGVDNPCSVSFSKKPKFVFVLFEDNSFVPTNTNYNNLGKAMVSCQNGVMCDNLTNEFVENVGLGFIGWYAPSNDNALISNNTRIFSSNNKYIIEWYITKIQDNNNIINDFMGSKMQFNYPNKIYTVIGLF